VKTMPIPEFALKRTTLPNAAKLAPPWEILRETFVPSGNGLEVNTWQPKRLRLVVRALRSFSDRMSVSSMLAANG